MRHTVTEHDRKFAKHMTENAGPLTDELLAELALGLRAVTTPTRLDQRIGEKLRARMAATAPICTQRADAARWIELCQGISVRVLRHDRKAGRLTAVWRLAAGARLPAHPHDRDEECLILEGEIQHEDELYRAGDYMVAPAGSQHRVISTRGGCSMLISGSDLSIRAQLA
jgi:quercetin dioxygenase-like cupin family protein